MSLLIDLLSRLGLGGAALTAATLAMLAFYLVKARSLGRTAANVGGAAVAYLVAVLTVGAFVLVLGWADPNPSVVWSHISRAAEVGADRASEPVRRLVRWVVDVVTS